MEDSEQKHADRDELTALRLRVERLEAEVSELTRERFASPAGMRSDGRALRAGPLPLAAAQTPPLSFVQPERPSLESRVGSQWFNRIGIVALLVGIAWSLKYAIDREWLGPWPRVIVGLLLGAALIAWSERFRRRQYPVFSFSLKALGTGVLYLVLWASFSIYHLLPYSVAFVGMVLVTALNGWMCWVQRSEVLAAFATVGGFLTPALLAQPAVSVFTLGTYLALLNAGLLTLLSLRRWPRLLPAAFVGTASYLLELAWGRGLGAGEQGSALLLALLFFAAFSLTPFLVAGMEGTGIRIAVGVALLNAVLGSLEFWKLAPPSVTEWVPFLSAAWFTALLVAGKLRGARAEAQLIHSGLVLAFVAVGLWTALAGPGTISGWTLEAAVLLVLSLRSRQDAAPDVMAPLLRSPVPSACLLGGAALLLIADSLDRELGPVRTVLFNERFGLYLLLIATAVLGVRVAAGHHTSTDGGAWPPVGRGAALLATVLLLIAGVLEIRRYWSGAGGTAEQFWISAWAGLLGIGLLVLGFRLRWAFLRWQALGLLTLAIAKVFLVDTRSLSQGFRIVSFLGLGVLLLCVSFIYQRDLLNLRGEEHGG